MGSHDIVSFSLWEHTKLNKFVTMTSRALLCCVQVADRPRGGANPGPNQTFCIQEHIGNQVLNPDSTCIM